MSKAVRIIPPTIDRYTMASIDKPRLRKVAAYARVSTDMLEQLTSYEAQIDYYTKYIKNHEGWEFVKVYTDMYNQRLIQRLADGSVENGLKRRLSADLSILPKAFFFMLWNDCMIAKAI